VMPISPAIEDAPIKEPSCLDGSRCSIHYADATGGDEYGNGLTLGTTIGVKRSKSCFNSVVDVASRLPIYESI
jgi:hypothetical protein